MERCGSDAVLALAIGATHWRLPSLADNHLTEGESLLAIQAYPWPGKRLRIIFVVHLKVSLPVRYCGFAGLVGFVISSVFPSVLGSRE